MRTSGGLSRDQTASQIAIGDECGNLTTGILTGTVQ